MIGIGAVPPLVGYPAVVLAAVAGPSIGWRIVIAAAWTGLLTAAVGPATPRVDEAEHANPLAPVPAG